LVRPALAAPGDPLGRRRRAALRLAASGAGVHAENKIGGQTKASLDGRQREMLLREQMAAIQRELGDEGSNKQDLADLEKAIAEAKMPPEVEAVAKKELRRLQRTPEAAAEYGMIRAYLDTLHDGRKLLPQGFDRQLNPRCDLLPIGVRQGNAQLVLRSLSDVCLE
jgi:hypothetical protein